MTKPPRQAMLVGVIAVVTTAIVVWLLLPRGDGLAGARPSKKVEEEQLKKIPFNGARAYEYLNKICELGPRMSGSDGMNKQQELLLEHFRKLGAEVELQRFRSRHPETGAPVKMANLIARWHPKSKERILLCAHYDTRPYPDQELDPDRRRDKFIGANDGASGVALLMELAHDVPELDVKYGVDFVLFDAEEFIFDVDRDDHLWFLGSTHFAAQYVGGKSDHRYKWGVLLDMIGDAELQIYQERSSVGWPETKPLVDEIWRTAADLKVREFVARPRHEVRDDHLPLRNIGKIPTCDIIDFDYPRPGNHIYWHTTDDVPKNCSALSLAKVGWVIREWLRRTK